MNNLIPLLPLIGHPDNIDDSTTDIKIQNAHISGQSEPNSMDRKKFEQWKSVASATAKLFLRGAKESADTFPPLKSVVGGLCFILDNCEVQ